MTGEITLSGWCCRSAASARRRWRRGGYGIKTFILPARNEPDLAELPPEVKTRDAVRPGADARGRAEGSAAHARPRDLT